MAPSQRIGHVPPWRPSVLAVAAALACAMPVAVRAQAAGTQLPRGTLPVLRGVVSGQAIVSAPVATSTGSKLTITQKTPQVVIDWKQFNIANGSEVNFDQASATYAALNRIYSLDPSIIQGKLSGKGQIFLINQNGILFDRGAQIDVNALYASTLNISNDRFAKGVASTSSDPAFAGGYDDTGASTTTTPTGTIQIGRYGSSGAAAPKITATAGGAIVMIAPVINNQSGVLTSPDGQVVLAAGSKAYLQFPAAADTTLRGLLVEIDADDGPVNLTSLIENAGTLQADRGNVTLAALAVNQNGRISASTALQRNGSIYLQASTLNNPRNGTVTLGLGSVTETPLDTTDTSTLGDGQSYDPYRAQIAVTAQTIVDSGVVRSPAGNVTFTAQDPTGTATPRIYLDGNAVIDVSGVTATTNHANDFATFKVTSNELKNSPDQRNGLLKGATVTVDLRQDSTLLDLSGYQANRQRTLAEKASSGGNVTLASSGDLILRQGSKIDASAGSIVDPGGMSNTTDLLGADGKVYNIATGPEALTYTALLDSYTTTEARWGQTQTMALPLFAQPVYEAGSRAGGQGGNITVFGKQGMVMDGSLSAGTTAGAQQMGAAPRAGSLTIGDFSNVAPALPEYGPGNVRFTTQGADTLGASFTASTPLQASQKATLVLSSDLFTAAAPEAGGTQYDQGNFDSVTIGAAGRITVPRGVTLAGGLGGSFAFFAPQIDVEGTIALPAGSIALNSVRTLAVPIGGTSSLPPYFIEVGGTLSTAGLWTNQAIIGAPSLPSAVASSVADPATTTAANGGSVAISIQQDTTPVDFARGSLIDVSGGGSVSAAGKVSGGYGGAISIVAATGTASDASTLNLGGELRGYAIGTGGSLAITTTTATIGGTTSGSGQFDAGFFRNGGFSSYAITGTNGLTTSSGSLVAPQQQNLVIDSATAESLASGASLFGAAQIQTLPDGQRGTASLSLGASLGQLALGTGAVLSMEPGAKVTLQGGAGGVDIDASVSAPGGSITIGDSDVSGQTARLHIGPHATLDVSSAFVPAAPSALGTALGLHQGTLLAGGTISITAKNATLVADAGSTLNVSGGSQTIDQVVDAATQAVQPTLVTSDAGVVSLQANDAFSFDATLLGHAEGTSAGGTFALTYNNRDDALGAASKRRIVVTDQRGAATGDPAYADAAIATVPLRSGGFDKLRLTAEDAIALQGGTVGLDFARAVTLDSPQLQVADGTQATLRSAQVTLANSYGQRTIVDAGSGSTKLDPTLPSLPVATYGGTGLLDVRAGSLALSGSLTINGAARTRLLSDHDITLTGRVVGLATTPEGAQLIGGLTTLGDVAMQATQIYPTTRSVFTIGVQDGITGTLVDGGAVTIAGNTNPAGAVLSAGGSLTIHADDITQGGTVKAPLGTLALDAGSALNLTSGSVTSVSAAGLTIPYGGTVAGVNWAYASTNAGTTDNGVPNGLTAPPAKSMTLTGSSVKVAPGATVDVSGGGDILGIEFVPGSGGTTNALAQPNTYALLPAAQLSSMPVDTAIALTQNLGGTSDGSVYNAIHIATNGAVPAGDYVLLPGYYALLPGAYLLQVQSGSSYASLQAGQSVALANGQAVLPAWRTVSGTDIRSGQTIGVVVRPGVDAQTLASYTVNGSDFFAQKASKAGQPAPLLPQDAGHLTLAASNDLVLEGSLVTAAASDKAKTAEIDITGQAIAVVDRTGRTDIASGFLQIAAADLTKIDGSVLLGGTRTDGTDGITVTPTASDVVVANSSATSLALPELMLAATDTITFAPGSSVSGSGSHPASAQNVTIDPTAGGSGAFVRASNSAAVTVTRTAPLDSSRGTVDIQAGATLGADGSLLVDATRDTTSAGTFKLAPGAALSLASSQIALGSAPEGTGGLVLGDAQLAGLAGLSALTLKSYGAIDVYGSGHVLGGSGAGSLTLDASALFGHAGSDGSGASLTASAGTLTLQNSGAAAASSPPPATGGLLAFDGGNVLIGAGDKAIAGFGRVEFNASGELSAQGQGTLTVGADLALSATRIAAASGSYQTWTAVDPGAGSPTYHAVTLTAPSKAAALPAAAGIGGVLDIEGASIASSGATTLVAHAGSITLAAHGAGGDVHLAAGTTLDASGIAKDFQGTTAIADAGSVSLDSDAGQVRLDAGSTVALSAASAGGHAGTLSVTGGTASLDGTLQAGAGSGQAGGSFRLDVGSLGDFSALNSKLNASGFTEARDVRVRSGSLTVAASDVVQASSVSLAADTAAIVVDGRIDASTSSSDKGGSVNLAAGTGLTLAASSTIDASNGATNGNGGTVAVSTRSGTLDFALGATIDVSGGAQGQAGRVTLTAPRTATNDGIQADLHGRVLSRRSNPSAAAATVDVEASVVHTVVDPVLTAQDIAGYADENRAFMASVDAVGIAAGITGDGGTPQGNVHVRPALELQASGDLRLDDGNTFNWDLTDPSAWLLANNASPALQAGTLTIRAAGNLTLSNVSLGLPENALHAGDTWNIELVGGADLQAANRMQTLPASVLNGQGNVLLDGPLARVTSGTGAISVAAGHDFQIDNNAGVVYTSGAPAKDTVEGGYGRVDQDTFGLWAQGGGNITITAGHDAIGTSSEWITDWYRRTVAPIGVVGEPGSWWVDRENFQQNVGALGGGNVTIAAGHDVTDLSAMVPTSGRIYSPEPITVRQGRSNVLGPGPFYLDVQGGGNLAVEAGHDLIGGEYLVSLGSGVLQAGHDVGGASPTQLYLMGQGSSPTRSGASIDVIAGGSVTLQSVANPTAVILTQSVGFDPSIGVSGLTINFLTYTADSSLSVAARSGYISIAGTMLDKPTLNPFESTPSGFGVVNNTIASSEELLPAKVTLVAYDGSVGATTAGRFDTYPSTTGGYQVLAGTDVSSLNLVQLSSATSGTGAISSWSNATTNSGVADITGVQGPLVDYAPSGRYVNDVVALTGDISDSTFNFPAVSRLWAGTNIDNVQATLQNTQATDISEIVANTGFVHPSTAGTVIAGPGTLLMQAGSDIDLGAVLAPTGLAAIGNNLNPALSDATSARLTLIAGVTGNVALDQLDAAYTALVAAGKANDKDAAKAAMAKVFASAKIGQGDIDTYLTSVETQQGSGVDLLAPGGAITVGLTTPPANTTVGIVTDSGGAIRSYLKGDFDINQGKVLTAQGGDIVIYTTDGSIDAGRGAKTSVTTPAPQRIPVLDSNGVLTGYIYKVAAAAAGSGIQTLTSPPGGPGSVPPPAGSIYLFAPSGTIDAGEAGIVSGANIFLVAQTVLNASNIGAQGSATGVPVAAQGSLAATVATTSGSVGAGTSKAADDAARSAADAARASADTSAFKSSILTVEVIGFGDKNCKENQKDCFGK